MSLNAPPPALGFAIIANAATPYREHLHRRIARELTEITLYSLYTHDVSNSPWKVASAPETHPVQFGKGESSNTQGKLRSTFADWKKGGRIIQWLKQHDMRAVLLLGYNDAGRVRVLRWCNKNNIPVFLWGDSNIKGDLARGLKRVLKTIVVSYIVKQLDAILPCGTLGAAFFKQYGAKPDQIFYSPCEPDYALITEIPASLIEAARTEYHLGSAHRRIVYSGRMVPHKRPELVVNAFIKIAHTRPEWDLVMIGDGVMRQSLEASVPDGLKLRVTWTGFLDDQSIVSALYRLSDVMVLPSDFEPWALVINEAAAAGLAIISSDVVGAAAELVKDGENGKLFPVGDAGRLEQCLLEVTQPDVCDRMKKQSHEVLRRWREDADPVDGIRRALRQTRLRAGTIS